MATNAMLNITWATKMLSRPCWKLIRTKNESRAAPSTISGAAMFRNITTSSVPEPRNRYRTSASAIMVPKIVATMVLRTAIRSEFQSADVRSGTPFHCLHQSNVKPCQRKDTLGAVAFAAVFALKLYRIITAIGTSR